MDYDLYRVKSIKKALQALKLFTGKYTELTLKDLSDELNVHKSTAYRIAITLTEEGFLRWDPYKGTYSLGLINLELGTSLSNSLELRKIARPHLEKMNMDLGETVNLGILDEGCVVYIDKIEGNRSIKLYSSVGKRAGCHCTALGKGLLAGISDREVKDILKEKGMKRFTNNTIVSISDFINHLERVREREYALDMEEHEPMVYCVAAPIKDHRTHSIAAISTTVIIKYFTMDMLEKYIETTKSVANSISCEMGFLPGNNNEIEDRNNNM